MILYCKRVVWVCFFFIDIDLSKEINNHSDTCVSNTMHVLGCSYDLFYDIAVRRSEKKIPDIRRPARRTKVTRYRYRKTIYYYLLMKICHHQRSSILRRILLSAITRVRENSYLIFFYSVTIE
jgi:hypothetical protein